ncbi:MAG: hypothetical protein SFW67_09955 [Myxococcaceae bacterium]|nr:hypothetical protein [Myxococcaceae bacterium]
MATREGSAPLAAEVAAVTGPDRLGEPIDRFLSACISALTAIESRSPAEATQEPPSTPGSVTAPTDPEISPETTGRWPAWLSFGGAGVSAAAGLIFAGVRIDAGVRLDRAYQPEGDERRAGLSFTEASSLASTGNVALVLSLVTLAVSVGLAVLGVVLLPSSDL